MRTNSEALLAVTASKDRYDFHRSVAISSSIYPDEDTHIENVTYGQAGDAMGLLFTTLTGGGTSVTRPLKWAPAVLAHPIRFVRLLWKRGWAKRTVIVLVMQTLNNSMRLKPIRVGRRKLCCSTEQDPDNPNPTWIPVANEAAKRIAEKIDGVPQSNLPEALLNIPATAHILGGAVIAADPDHGVVDMQQRVFGYENLMICDGSVDPGQPGRQPESRRSPPCRARDDIRARPRRSGKARAERCRQGGPGRHEQGRRRGQGPRPERVGPTRGRRAGRAATGIALRARQIWPECCATAR